MRRLLILAAVLLGTLASAQTAQPKPGTHTYTLTCTDSSSLAVKFNFYRATSATGTPVKLNASPLTTCGPYVDVATPLASYWYTATALDASGNESTPSTPLAVTVPGVPAVPTSLTLTSVGTTVVLAWPASAATQATTGYNIYRGTATGTYTLLGSVNSSTLTYTDNSATAATTYFYAVTASAGKCSSISQVCGESPYSTEASITTAVGLASPQIQVVIN